MSLCSLIYNNTQGISSANDLIQIINEYWKSALFKFVMISQTGIFNAALNVSDTDYPLEYNERSLVLFTKN